ncbi:Putative zinc- or iron-chelating domain-containing protein [Desulfonema limicola]|uniref:Zinc- or iron-chelating domain-containing protein n=1 Tax=Desulfonema limicola TaxID=45656 RepID=A0A975BCY6_9BACT|nr:YkgJ family cysteine cluster protein [Desulfonema limicola]QTA83182.1 Putative zinc- or iron-chelating domain-containing protein [Desulfonema limicola]
MPCENEPEIFECRQCGECCKGYGGTYISQKDIQAIADYIKVSPQEFLSRYCRQSGSKTVIAQAENGYCIFWKDKICTIHPVKPEMCRQWPFIQSVIKDVNNWRIMAGMCPGMRTDVSDERIIQSVKQKLKQGSA